MLIGASIASASVGASASIGQEQGTDESKDKDKEKEKDHKLIRQASDHSLHDSITGGTANPKFHTSGDTDTDTDKDRDKDTDGDRDGDRERARSQSSRINPDSANVTENLVYLDLSTNRIRVCDYVNIFISTYHV